MALTFDLSANHIKMISILLLKITSQWNDRNCLYSEIYSPDSELDQSQCLFLLISILCCSVFYYVIYQQHCPYIIWCLMKSSIHKTDIKVTHICCYKPQFLPVVHLSRFVARYVVSLLVLGWRHFFECTIIDFYHHFNDILTNTLRDSQIM